jgi:hypothetical protein
MLEVAILESTVRAMAVMDVVGGVVQLNTTVASTSKTCTFGTVSSSSTATNEIYIRVALTSGQTVTGLSLKAATN